MTSTKSSRYAAWTTLAVMVSALNLGCAKAPYVWASEVPRERARPPAGDEAINAGDGITVTVAGQPQLSGSFTVGADGTISLPEVGPVAVAPHTPANAEKLLAARVATIIESPRVSVMVALRRIQIAILGEVRVPGKYLLASGDGVVQAIAAAGGLGEFAGGDSIYLVRASEPVRIRFRMQDLLRGGVSASEFSLRDGDLLVVE